MKFKFFILLFFLSFLIIGCGYGGNNTTNVTNPTTVYLSGDTVTALESGDSNISFSDGYKGYCIEWGEHSAEQNDTYYVDNSFKIVNKVTGEDVSNHIKTFFVYFYENATKNTIVTQHIIWKFTDNKEFSQFRANKELYYAILDKSTSTIVPNSGVLKVDNTTEMVYTFKVFKAKFLEYQDYFGYNIFFRNITDNTIKENNTIVNKTDATNNTPYNNDSLIKFNNTILLKEDNHNTSYILNKDDTIKDFKTNISNHVCGRYMEWIWGWIIILAILTLLLYPYKKK